VRQICWPDVAITTIAIALWFGSGSIVEAQPPIRIGASLSLTGTYAAFGQNQNRGYQQDGVQIAGKMLHAPVAGRQEGDRLAWGAGAGEAALSHAAVEPALRTRGAPLWLTASTPAEAQRPSGSGTSSGEIELTAEDDRSQVANAVAIYDRLITQDKVATVLSPYSSPITDAIANITEKHRMPRCTSTV